MNNHNNRKCPFDLKRALRLSIVTIGRIYGKSETPVK